MLTKRVSGSQSEAELSVLDRGVLALLYVYLLTHVLGGVIRYLAARHGFPWLPYVPHMLLAIALVPMAFFYLTSEGITFTYVALFVLFGAGATYGIVNLGRASQVEFALWVLLIFLYGVVAFPAVVRAWRKLTPYIFTLWAMAVAGVLINVFYQWPWIGFGYQVDGASLEASRMWTTSGLALARLPGFSTDSFFVGVQVLLLAISLRETLPPRWRIPMWILSGVAIALTTSKTPTVIYLVLSGMWLFGRGRIRPSWRLIPFAAACLDILLPFSMLLVKNDWFESVHSPVGILLLGSLAGRAGVGWPDWIRMIVRHGNVVLGRGIGGIGRAQLHFEPALYSPADNVAVYVYGTFGVLGLALLLLYGLKASRMPTEGPIGRFLFFAACVVLLEGVTVNVIEGSFTALALGITLRYLDAFPAGVLGRARKRSQGMAGAESGFRRPARA